MGLDSFLYRRGITPEGILLEELEKGIKKTELGYWRKRWEIHELFCKKLGGEDDNCVEVVLTIEELKNILKVILEKKDVEESLFEYTKEVLRNAIEETNFQHEEIFYYAWY